MTATSINEQISKTERIVDILAALAAWLQDHKYESLLYSTEMRYSSLLLFYTYQRRLYTILRAKLGPLPRGFGCMHFLSKTKTAVAPTIIFENKNPSSMF